MLTITNYTTLDVQNLLMQKLSKFIGRQTTPDLLSEIKLLTKGALANYTLEMGKFIDFDLVLVDEQPNFKPNNLFTLLLFNGINVPFSTIKDSKVALFKDDVYYISPVDGIPHKHVNFKGIHQIPMNFVDGWGGKSMLPKFKGKSTMQLILEGYRTGTSRDMSKPYTKPVRQGDLIIFYDKAGTKVLVQVTTDPKWVKDVPMEHWCKFECWDEKVYKSLLDNPNYAQFEFILIDKV